MLLLKRRLQIFRPHIDRGEQIQLGITYVIRCSLLVAMAGSAWELRWFLLFASTVIFFLTFFPDVFERQYQIYLPIEIEFVIILFLYASLFLGEIKGYYTRFWWWDVTLHACSGVVLGFAGFLILYILYRKERLTSSPYWISFFAFCFAVAIGTVWEIFEFFMDQTFNFNMQKSGLVDTMWDLIVDSLGALFASAVGFYYIKGRKEGVFNRIITKFIAENPRYFERS